MPQTFHLTQHLPQTGWVLFLELEVFLSEAILP